MNALLIKFIAPLTTACKFAIADMTGRMRASNCKFFGTIPPCDVRRAIIDKICLEKVAKARKFVLCEKKYAIKAEHGLRQAAHRRTADGYKLYYQGEYLKLILQGKQCIEQDNAFTKKPTIKLHPYYEFPAEAGKFGIDESTNMIYSIVNGKARKCETDDYWCSVTHRHLS